MDFRLHIKIILLTVMTVYSSLGFSLNDNQKTRVACIGNSVTKGYGLNNPETEAYPAQLQKLLGDQFQVGNFGHNGATLLFNGHNPYINTEEYKKALNFNADIFVIHLGLNDTDPRNWPNYRDDFIKDFTRFIHSLFGSIQFNPQVFICRMTPIFNQHPRFKSGTQDWYWQIQEAIQQVATNFCFKVVDLHKPLYNRPDLFKDALHPNKEGAGIIAQTVANYITGNFGGLKVASIFSDNMVMQQKQAIQIWGKANAEDKITVKFQSQIKECTTNYAGDWKVELEPLSPGGPYNLLVSVEGEKKIVFDNILIGEVWLCSGQSNMAFTLKQSFNSGKDISESKDSHLRLFNLKGTYKTSNTSWNIADLRQVNKLNYFYGKWEGCSPQSVANFSAIGYYFANQLRKELNVPVGIIEVAVGGAPAEAFVDRNTMESHPVLVDALYNWKENDFIMDWCRERAKKNLAYSTDPLQRHPYEPAYIYEAGISQLVPFPVQGVIWYQGESNAHNPEYFQILFPELVRSWRKSWNNHDLPFYFAQLSGIDRPGWPLFRETQRRLSHSIPNTEMVVTSDLGDSLNVHPIHKKEIGERFARLALANIYGFDMVCKGPEPIAAIQEKGKIAIIFSNALELSTSDRQPAKEFEASGFDGIFKPVQADIIGNKITIVSEIKPIYKVRYGWKPFSRGNLVNEAKLPASSFEITVTTNKEEL